MARKIKIVFNSAAVAEILSSDEAQADLHARGTRILDAANAAVPDSDDAFKLSEWVAGGSSKLQRAMASVRTANYEGRRAEAESRVLVRALDAGRG